MQAFIKKTLKSVFNVHPDERLKTAAMSAYFFLTIGLIYILKPIRSSLFLDQLGAENLRYIYMGEGLSLILVVAVYVWLSKRIARRQFFIYSLLFFALNALAFRELFHTKQAWVSAFFYIWVSAFSITSTTQFWILANEVFNTHDAKRLFGIVISAGSLGGIVCGFLTGWLTRWVATEDFLILAAGILLLCAFLVGYFWNSLEVHKTVSQLEQLGNDKPAKTESKGIGTTGYFMMLAGVVIIAKMSSTVIDNQFNRIVELAVSGKAQRTMFFANFMAWLNIASLISQFCLTGICLRKLGTHGALSILPIGLLFFAGGSLIIPGLAFGVFLKIFDGSMSYSIQQAGKEMLYLPLPNKIRLKMKPIIDMLGFRAAKSLSGLYIAFMAPLFSLPDERLSVLVLFLIPIWIFLVWRVYQMASRDNTESPMIPAVAQEVSISVP